MAHGIFLDYPNWNVAKQDNWVSVFEELDNEIPCTVRKTHSMFIGTTRLGGRAGIRPVSSQFLGRDIQPSRKPQQHHNMLKTKRQDVRGKRGPEYIGWVPNGPVSYLPPGPTCAFKLTRTGSKELVCPLCISRYPTDVCVSFVRSVISKEGLCHLAAALGMTTKLKVQSYCATFKMPSWRVAPLMSGSHYGFDISQSTLKCAANIKHILDLKCLVGNTV